MRDEKTYCVYILASKPHGTLYIGFSGDLTSRMEQHLSGAIEGFTKRYGVHRLVHFEVFGNASEGIQREKTMKKWPRQWKINLIERDNPHWDDLHLQTSRNYQVAPIQFGVS